MIEDIIGYSFRERAHLERALTRLAYASEQGLGPDANLDALATLGDAVLDVVVIKALMDAGETEKGVISRRKMEMVNMSVLRRLAESIELQKYVHWGRGEITQRVWVSGRVLAECMEALCGALFLDGGLWAVESVLTNLGFSEQIRDS